MSSRFLRRTVAGIELSAAEGDPLTRKGLADVDRAEAGLIAFTTRSLTRDCAVSSALTIMTFLGS